MDQNQSKGVVADGADDLDVIRRLEFPQLTRELFAELCKWAKERGLDVRRNHVAGEVRMIDGLPRLQPMVKIDGLRAKAHATGRYGGCHITAEHWTPDGNLVWMEATAKRKVGREWIGFPQRAYLERYCPGGKAPAPFWEKGFGQPQQLAKCAQALAIRDAFSEFGGLYIPEEMDQQLSPGPAGGGGAARSEREASERRDGDGEDPPATPMQLHMRLKDWGVTEEPARNAVITHYREKWNARDDDSPSFYADVWRDFARDPARHGGRRPEVAQAG